MRKKTFAVSLLAIMSTLTFSVDALANKVVLKLGHNLENNHVVSKAINYFAKDLKKKSNGEIVLRVYPGGQMGGPRENLEMLQNKALDMTKANASELEPFVAEFGIFNLPYLFKDENQFKRVLYGPIGSDLAKKLDKEGMKIVASYVGGSRSFYTKKPVHSPADLKGMKIRVLPTPSNNKAIELLGASPVPIPLGEVYTAMQQGVIDGAENNIPSYYQTRHAEVAKNYAIDEHTSIPDYVVISNAAWDKLSPEQQKVFMEAAKDSEKFQQELWEKEMKTSREGAEKLGVVFTEVDKEPFRKALAPMYDDFLNDPKMAPLVKQIQADAKNP